MHHSTSGHGRASRDRWLVSYADFITLLFAFFATMYAMSSLDAKKLSTVAQALQVAFDEKSHRAPLTLGNGVLPDRGPALVAPPADTIETVREQLLKDLGPDLLVGDKVELITDRRGLILSIPEAGVFPVGSDDLSLAAQELIGRMATSLGKVSNVVRVEGHTDDVPIHNVRFASNWDLSAARASRVVEFLIARGVAPDRLSATGYAEFHPRVPNASVEARATNRRIDLVILNAATLSAEEPRIGGSRQ
jgi:chemotaxis protein MotB